MCKNAIPAHILEDSVSEAQSKIQVLLLVKKSCKSYGIELASGQLEVVADAVHQTRTKIPNRYDFDDPIKQPRDHSLEMKEFDLHESDKLKNICSDRKRFASQNGGLCKLLLPSKYSVWMFMLILVLITLSALITYILVFPRTQIDSWMEVNGAGLIAAVVGASFAAAGTFFTLFTINPLFLTFWRNTVSKAMFFPFSNLNIHKILGVIILTGSLVHGIAWLAVYFSLVRACG